MEIFQLLLSENPRALPYASLREWTGDFKTTPAGDGPYGIIGKGAFGEVFKGLAMPPEGTNDRAVAFRIAVKRMDTRVLQLDGVTGKGPPESFIDSYRREIHVLSRFRHPNIVRLIGFSEPCPERREPPCLVYELLALGSLSGQLRDDGQAALLPWQTRVDILLQISTAINYLHCHNPGYPAYHRDIKADNIALSADYTAKLIDCGYGKQTALIATIF
jgi:interleukin-1 receptor-associated kinase 4